VSVALKSVPGVETVEVSLNQGSAVVKMKANNTTTLKALLEAITKNGFVTKQTSLSVRGTFMRDSAGNLKFRVAGSNEEFSVMPGSAAQPPLDTIGVVEGIVPEVPSGKVPDRIQIKAVKSENTAK